MLHTAYLFDVEQFRDQVKEYLDQLDKGVYEPLYRKYQEVLLSTKPEEWVLHDQGTTLEDFLIEGHISSFDLGYLLLVYLSTFMKKCPSPGSDYGLLFRVLLESAGWDEDHIWLLLRGMPVGSIFKPEDKSMDFSFHMDGPYWKLVFPSQSWQRGWLPVDKAIQLKQDLLAIKDHIYSLDESFLEEFFLGPFGRTPVKPRLKRAFDTEFLMLSEAERLNLALYLVIS